MTFTATPQPANIPPRVRIDVNTDDVAKFFTGLVIKRDGKPIREQPFVGGSVAVAFDYEPPFGISATYTAEGAVTGYTSILANTWANLTGWATSSGSPAVGSSRLISGAVSRTTPIAFFSAGKIVLAEPPTGTARFRFGSIWLDGNILKYEGGETPVNLGTGQISLVWDTNQVTLTSTAGTWVRSNVGEGATSPLYMEAGTGWIPAFTIYQAVAPTSFTGTLSVTLGVAAAWLIHPSQPSLSRPIDDGPSFTDSSLTYVDASTASSRSSKAQATVHQPIGRRRAVVITPGPRQADEWNLVLATPTTQQRNDIRALVDDQTPLLLRAPVSFDWDLPDDWYSIGDVQMARSDSPFVDRLTTITLPLTPVDEPIVRQGALWTYGTDLLAHPTYADSLVALPTYLDRLAGAV